MARSKRGGSTRSRILLYMIPIIALVGAVGVYALASYSPPPRGPVVQDYTFQITLQESNGSAVRFIVPQTTVGVSGGTWSTHQYDGESVDLSHYPIYMDLPANPYPGFSTVHVRSITNRQYTVGDLFNVWGETLGQNDTFHVKAKGNYLWQMCTGSTTGTARPALLWGGTPISPGLAVTLLYYDNVNGLGCA